MSGTMPFPSSNTKSDISALNAFVTQNSDLERLESILAQFNLFEAIGVIRQELRHSDFLAFLLDPSRNHGIADAFLKQFLQEVSPDDYMEGSFEAVDVRREWSHIDILLLNERQRFVLLIENKIWAGQHSDQLKRYYDEVQREWPDYNILAVYLTPKGDESNHPDYIAIDYGVVCRAAEAVSANLQGRLDPGVYLLLTHYAQMLRRHIMTDTEVANLCDTIYAKHRRALDLLFEHKPDRRSEIAGIARHLFTMDSGWNYDKHGFDRGRGDAWVNCLPDEWENHRFLRFLFCQLRLSATALDFTINIWNGNGNPFNDRLQLWDMAKRFGWPVQKLRDGNNQTVIYRHTILRMPESETDSAEWEDDVEQHWGAFLARQYEDIKTRLEGEKWLWDERAPPPTRSVTQSAIGEYIKRLIDADADFLRRHNDGNGFVNFGLCEWDVPGNYRWQHEDGFWLVHFNFVNGPDSLTICLGVERGDQADRNRLLHMVQKHKFVGFRNERLKKNWSALTSYPILQASDYEKTQEEAEALISQRWATYRDDELPRIAQALREEP